MTAGPVSTEKRLSVYRFRPRLHTGNKGKNSISVSVGLIVRFFCFFCNCYMCVSRLDGAQNSGGQDVLPEQHLQDYPMEPAGTDQAGCCAENGDIQLHVFSCRGRNSR